VFLVIAYRDKEVVGVFVRFSCAASFNGKALCFVSITTTIAGLTTLVTWCFFE
jgi:hypothetical protein